MKKVIIIGAVVAGLVIGGVLLSKHLAKKKELLQPNMQSEKKQTLMQEIMDIVADTKIDAIDKTRLAKLNMTDLVSLKVAVLDVKNSGGESAMSPANKKVLSDLIIKMIKP
jgi:hypothetical protein